jgi:hypothetical protein
MFRLWLWRGTRGTPGATPPPITGDQAVGVAEAIVCRAWARELLRQRDHMEFALRAASEDCDAAYAALAAAQRDGDPRKISVAHAALEQAVDATRKSALACERVRQTLRSELDLLTRASKERAVSSRGRRPDHGRSTIVARLPDAQSPPTLVTPVVPTARDALGTARSRARFSQWLSRLFPSRTASLEHP